MAEPLWTLGEIAEAIGAETAASPATPVGGVSIDSRSLIPGEAFIALRANRDGHAFVAAALEAGAVCAIIEQDFPPGAEDKLLRVGDTLAALTDLGRAARARAVDIVVIAVTGSVGKSGTNSIAKTVLLPSF